MGSKQDRQKTSVTDSASNPLTQATDQAPAGRDDLLVSVISGVKEFPNELDARRGDTTRFFMRFLHKNAGHRDR